MKNKNKNQITIIEYKKEVINFANEKEPKNLRKRIERFKFNNKKREEG